MHLLRRLLQAKAPEAGKEAPVDPTDLDALEGKRELEVLQAEQERLNELQQRQLRYQQYSWRPPAQGGERRADDDAGSGDPSG
jgi:hypothetical protein